MERERMQRGFRVRGSVQGVGFRWWTRRLAQDPGVEGTVRNCPDGSVEVRIRAAEPVLAEFAQRLQEGPPMALVRSVEAFPVPDDLPNGFEIVHWA